MLPDVPWMRKFQFLIGRLRTVNGQPGLEDTVLFQFLIGRLRTFISDSLGPIAELSFNSS